MTGARTASAAAPSARRAGPPGRASRRTGLVVGGVLLAVLCVASVAVGTRAIPLGTTIDALLAFDPSNDLHLLTVYSRVPRTILAILVGASLGVAGAVMQAMTRNPLAEPGILGVNAGAAAAVATGAAFLGVTNVLGYVWFAFIGAAVASIAVAVLGRAHAAGTNPVRLVLAGAALAVVLGAYTTVVIVNAPSSVYSIFRSWTTGSLFGRGYEVLPVAAAACLAGLLLALTIAGPLNAVALGGDMSAALGVSARRTWVVAIAVVLLLAGGATAVAGPIAFVGLAAPHIARSIVGPDQRAVIPSSMLVAAVLLLLADVLGRIVVLPSEIPAGIMTAIIGGPFFIHLVRNRRIARL